MHVVAPIPILFGIMSLVFGLFWLIAAGSEEDGGPRIGLFWLLGAYYVGWRVLRQLVTDPMSVLPGFYFVLAGIGLIWLGVAMW